MKINIHLLHHFTKINRLSSLRLYMYVKNKCNNHLHKKDLKQIRSDLKISNGVIYKCLKQLIELGICYKHSEDYWRFNSWKKTIITSKNRNLTITLEELCCLKKLRTLSFMVLYRSAWRMNKKNSIKERTKRLTSGFRETSASFVKRVTGTTVTEQTLLNHLHKGVKNKFAEAFCRYEVILSSSNLDDLHNARKYIQFPTTIRKNYRSTLFEIIRYRPYKTRFSI